MALNFKGKKVTVAGLGFHGGGIGSAKWLAQQGANVLVTDLKTENELAFSIKQLEGLNIDYVLGEHREEDFRDADMIIKSPAIPTDSPYLRAARENSVPIETDIGIFLQLCQAPICGVTGTKGKSTTTSLIYELLKKKYPKTIMAGNIRTSVLEKIPEIDPKSPVVLELSSWQLSDLKDQRIKLHWAVITNVMYDHMNRYNGFDDYLRDKLLIFRDQRPGDYLILNYENEISRSCSERSCSQPLFYGLEKPSQHPGAYVCRNTIVWGEEEKTVCPLQAVQMLGKHNLSNSLAAITVAYLAGVMPEQIQKTLKDFKGISYRLEFIKDIGGILFYNDTTASTPEATVAAFQSLPNPIVLIAGGSDKNLSFGEVGEVIAQKAKSLILLDGKATPKLEAAIEESLKETGRTLNIQRALNMENAVRLAYGAAVPGDAVLLSPACASFGMFRHEFERGDKFNEAVRNLESKQ